MQTHHSVLSMIVLITRNVRNLNSMEMVLKKAFTCIHIKQYVTLCLCLNVSIDVAMFMTGDEDGVEDVWGEDGAGDHVEDQDRQVQLGLVLRHCQDPAVKGGTPLGAHQPPAQTRARPHDHCQRRHDHRCVLWSQVCVVITGVCHDHRCLSWSQVCHDHRCLSWSQMCVMITDVCHDHRCLSWSQVFVMITGVCHDHRCLSWSQMCVMITDVCHDHRCLSWSQVFVMITGVCHDHRCLSWSQVCVMITGVCHDHRCVSVPGNNSCLLHWTTEAGSLCLC